MTTEQHSSPSSSEPVTISIHDPETGSQSEYRVHPSVAGAIKRLLEGPPETEKRVGDVIGWDSGCRV